MTFAPLGAVPLAATLHVTFASDEAETTITFGGSARPRLRTLRTATGTLTFAGLATGERAGRPIVFTAMAESFVFRAAPDVFDFDALPMSFMFRGKPE